MTLSKPMLLALGALAATVLLLWSLGPVLTPFAAAAGLAYLGDPLVDRLEKLKLSRTLAVTLVFVVIFAFSLLMLALLTPLLIEQIAAFFHSLPDWLRWAQAKLVALGLPLPGLDAEALRVLLSEHGAQAGGIASALLKPVTQSGLALMGFAANLLLIPVVTFYLLRDWDVLMSRIHALIPQVARPTVETLARETDEVLGAFLRGQLLVMAALALIYTLGLMAAGLNLALLIGLAAGLVSFVPYLGFIVGLGAASVAMLVQTPELAALLPVVAVFAIGQALESMLLTPWLVGDRIGLHPVAVIFAVMAGAQWFGLVGVLLALPAAAIIAVLLRYAHARWAPKATSTASE
ncbi:MAG: AI-2E family transporter [Pseudomonadota bacterium]